MLSHNGSALGRLERMPQKISNERRSGCSIKCSATGKKKKTALRIYFMVSKQWPLLFSRNQKELFVDSQSQRGYWSYKNKTEAHLKPTVFQWNVNATRTSYMGVFIVAKMQQFPLLLKWIVFHKPRIHWFNRYFIKKPIKYPVISTQLFVSLEKTSKHSAPLCGYHSSCQ